MDVVRGHLQDYAWGPVDGLSQWCSPTHGPQAELWFGAHPNGPSPLRGKPGVVSGVEAPILTKLLAAARPLSLQIHPQEVWAADRFAAQEADTELPRLLSDPYGKAEILIALEPFSVLQGIREPAEAAAVLAAVGPPLQAAADHMAIGRTGAAIRELLVIPERTVVDLSPAVIAAVPAGDREAMSAVVEAFPGDPGIFVAAILRHRVLRPFEAVYVHPGILHAYVRGRGVEVMTSSDNVLRLGLTPKTIAVDEALDALEPQAQPVVVAPRREEGVRRYRPAGAPFEVDVLQDCTRTVRGGRYRTVLCLSGVVWADLGGRAVELGPGDAVLAYVADGDVVIRVDGMCVVAQPDAGD